MYRNLLTMVWLDCCCDRTLGASLIVIAHTAQLHSDRFEGMTIVSFMYYVKNYLKKSLSFGPKVVCEGSISPC